MNFRSIEAIVRDQLGLDPASLGPPFVERAVEARMAACALDDLTDYASRLKSDPRERDALAAELVVPETWFFRGGYPLFSRLAGIVAERLHHLGSAPPARVLSIPCSTGEEPYSLAIALHERFIQSDQVHIDAVDVSQRALDKARLARYGSFSFREANPELRTLYFLPHHDLWELLPHLRAYVHFHHGNLTDPRLLAGERPYDLIICRNLFIYLTPEARQQALFNLERLLTTDGRLCLTAAEADRLPTDRFVRDGPTEMGIYRRLDRAYRVDISQPTPLPSDERMIPTPVVPPADKTLQTARSLADAGHLEQARRLCEELLAQTPTDADTLALLGVIHLALGQTETAFDLFRKTLYLMPDHVEALSHMLALCERKGDRDRAAVLRRRLQNATPGETP
ncbi:MAG: CheR family methyltransferase [Gemmataceae bacterium]|nr:hypothetical protein [Gemmata sp.]MDW8196067.1 CheR family methyltransferase [Gemmataceae bacterium]